MKIKLLITVVAIALCAEGFSQKRPMVKILMFNGEPQCGFSKNFELEFPENGCFTKDWWEYNVTIGEVYNVIRIGDEMNNTLGVLIVDKEGYQIDITKVQEMRKTIYKTAKCCVYVKEYKGKLYFYDIVDLEGNDYHCSDDSQTDASEYKIPRYYIFNAKKNKVKMVELETPCTKLIVGGKLVCK
ncbi:hypothetical protein JYT72_00415 [Crocinitomix catalasitica]|nr:hypothetical protein [Crocinitomix catalasitica]